MADQISAPPASIRPLPPLTDREIEALIFDARNEMVLAAERHSNVVPFRRPAKD